MKDEFNDLHAYNGEKDPGYGEYLRPPENDRPHTVAETPLAAQPEIAAVAETPTQDPAGETGADLTFSATGAPPASAVSTVTTTLGSGIGALVSVAAAAAATAVIVVSVFVSTLTVKLSLVMADMYALIFQVELDGAQEEDFEHPLFAVLSDAEGEFFEQEIFPDTLYLLFEGLSPGREYVIVIKNEERILLERSYCTAAEPVEKGSLFASFVGGEVLATVEDIRLRSDEYYTLTAKNARGETVFVKDSDDGAAQFRFPVPEPQTLYLSLSSGGRVFALFRLEPGDKYDLDHPVWTWDEDFAWARVAFAHYDGGEDLILDAAVEIASETPPTCETEGLIEYLAAVTLDGLDFTDIQTAPLAAIGHAYGEPVFEWNEIADGYTADAVFTCLHDSAHTERVAAEVSMRDEYNYDAIVAWNGTTYTDVFHLPEILYLSLDDGNVTLFATEYDQEGQTGTFVSTEQDRYFISGGQQSNASLEIFGGDDAKAVFYLTFDNVMLLSYESTAPLRIGGSAGVDVYIENLGITDLQALDCPVIEWVSDGTLNLYVTSEGGFDTFRYGSSGSDDYTGEIFAAVAKGTIHFYMNGTEVDAYGAPVV